VKARSPVSKRIRFSLGAAFAAISAHQRRHLWQARQLRNDPAFPAVARGGAGEPRPPR
jgi:hypothetical protein